MACPHHTAWGARILVWRGEIWSTLGWSCRKAAVRTGRTKPLPDRIQPSGTTDARTDARRHVGCPAHEVPESAASAQANAGDPPFRAPPICLHCAGTHHPSADPGSPASTLSIRAPSVCAAHAGVKGESMGLGHPLVRRAFARQRRDRAQPQRLASRLRPHRGGRALPSISSPGSPTTRSPAASTEGLQSAIPVPRLFG